MGEKKTLLIKNRIKVAKTRPVCANCGLVDELNTHYREESSFVLPKPYLMEVLIEHAHQLTTKGSISCILLYVFSKDCL